MDILNLAEMLEQETISLRHYFHKNPELSGFEVHTCEYVYKYLKNQNIDCVNIPNGGVLGFIHGKANGKCVLLRADVDALLITESEMNLRIRKSCVSDNSGVCHACGHDAHTAMLLSAARIIKKYENDLKGSVILMFERGEEKATNCTRLYRYIEEHDIVVDSSFGIHVYADLESGLIAVNDIPVMSSNVCFDVKISGKGGHGSRPDQANSPIDCFATVHQALSTIRMNHVSPFHPMTYSIGLLSAGMNNNSIPEDLIFKGTCRFTNREDGFIFRQTLDKILDNITTAYGCTYEYLLLRGPCFPVINTPECAAIERSMLVDAIGAEHVCQCDTWLASETFARTITKWPGVFVLLGIHNEKIGTGAPHHSSLFDIDDDVLKYGVAAYVCYAIGFLKSDIHPEGYPGSFADMYEDLCLPEDEVKYLRRINDDYEPYR